MKIGNDVNLCKLCSKKKRTEQYYSFFSWNTSKRWRCERKWRLQLNSSQVDILSPFILSLCRICNLSRTDRTDEIRFVYSTRSVAPYRELKGVELFDHILRRGGYFFFLSLKGGKRWDGKKNYTSTRWHIQI